MILTLWSGAARAQTPPPTPWYSVTGTNGTGGGTTNFSLPPVIAPAGSTSLSNLTVSTNFSFAVGSDGNPTGAITNVWGSLADLQVLGATLGAGGVLSNFTMTVWFKQPAVVLTNFRLGLIATGTPANTTRGDSGGNGNNLFWGENSGGGFQFYVNNRNGNSTTTSIAPGPTWNNDGVLGTIQSNRWYFVAITYSAQSNLCYLYSGSQSNTIIQAFQYTGTGSDLGGPLDLSAATSICMMNRFSGGRAFPGEMDYFNLYTNVLSFDQIGAVQASEQPPATFVVTSQPHCTPTNTIFSFSPSGVTLTESASGATPLYYQWKTDGGGGLSLTNIPGSNSTSLYFYTTNVGTYVYACLVTNVYGPNTSVSTNVVVLPPSVPRVTTDVNENNFTGPLKTNFYAFIGGNVGFNANFALGTLPITNQWLFNNGTGYVPIVGASSNSWTVTNVSSGSAGYYELAATNMVGRSNSTPAHLTALADPGAPTNVGTNMYAYCVYTNNPRAYWKFEETQDTFTSSMQAYDYSGNNFDATYGNFDGTANSGCPDGGENITGGNAQYGPNPNDFQNAYPGIPSTNGCAGLSTFNNGYLKAPPINLNTDAVTFTMWIYPNDPSGVIAPSTGLLMNRNGGDAAGVGFGGTATTNMNQTAALSYTWNTNQAATYNWNSVLYPIPQKWQFVAYVMTPTNTTIYLYYVSSGHTNLFKAVNNLTNSPESFSGGTTWIGSDNFSNARNFNGYIDEVAVFTKSMSETQIQDLFLKALGKATGGVAPQFTRSPANTTLYRGQTLLIPALAGGIPDPSYQWQVNSGGNWYNATNDPATGIFGATNATFGWTNYTGLYSQFRCLAYNAYGTNKSSSDASLGVSVTFLPVPTNGQWIVNFSVTSVNNGGTGLPYVGHGVLVGPNGTAPGTYWNALSGSQLTSSTSYLDDGATVSGISFGSTGFPGSFSSLANFPVPDNVLLDTFAQITPTNSFVFHNVPNGKYNLALYGCIGAYTNRGTTFTVNGASQSVTNVQDVSFLPDNMVIYTNVLVTNGSLQVDMASVLVVPGNTNSTEGAFNGAQLQLVKYGTSIVSLTKSGGNFILTYAGGWLEESTNVDKNWSTNLTATSPYTIYPTGQQKFYRIYSPTNPLN
jgi:hypothetical protein